MFGFITRWRVRRARAIFRYWDGTQNRTIDPLEVLDAIDNDPEFESIDAKLADTGQRESIFHVANMVCRAFKVKQFENGQGLTIRERLQLYKDFGAWISELKKNIDGTRSLPPSSGLAKVFPKSEAETMAAIADSSSISPSSNGTELTPSA